LGEYWRFVRIHLLIPSFFFVGSLVNDNSKTQADQAKYLWSLEAGAALAP
jgi:hypothetical protein